MSAARPISQTRFARAGKRKLPAPPDEPMKINFDDLPTWQISQIERLAGTSISRWHVAPSNGDQMAAVVSVMYEVDFETAAQETPRTLAKYVEIVEDEEVAEGQEEDDGSGN
jgi:hypothetical protein